MKANQRSETDGSFTSSENLDEYIRVSKPGTKVVLAALLIVLASVLVWGFTGKLPVTETVKGLVVNTETAKQHYQGRYSSFISDIDLDKKDIIYCFIDASRFNVMQVRDFSENAVIEMPDHTRLTGRILANGRVPLSREECEKILFDNEWVTDKCVGDYSWMVIVEPDADVTDYEFMLADVSMVTKEVVPISFLAG